MLVKTNLTIGVLVFAALLRGESYVSPAQGPPVASPTNANTILVREYITDPLKNSLDQKLAQINATLAARTDARAKVRLLNVKVYSPLLLPTQFTDRPNHRFVALPRLRSEWQRHRNWLVLPGARVLGRPLQR